MSPKKYDALQRHVRDSLEEVLATVPADRREAVANSVAALVTAHGGYFGANTTAGYDIDGDQIIHGDRPYWGDAERSLCQAAYDITDEWPGWSADVNEGATQPVSELRAPGLDIDTQVRAASQHLEFELRAGGFRHIRVTLEDDYRDPALVKDLVQLLARHAAKDIDDIN